MFMDKSKGKNFFLNNIGIVDDLNNTLSETSEQLLKRDKEIETTEILVSHRILQRIVGRN